MKTNNTLYVRMHSRAAVRELDEAKKILTTILDVFESGRELRNVCDDLRRAIERQEDASMLMQELLLKFTTAAADK